jgi:cellulose synthase/poly-beta-1,6-N-acetylglucosamine synthase-like glycosyltransferase
MWIEVVNNLMLIYFASINFIYLSLLLLASFALYRNWQYRDLRDLPARYTLAYPPISVLIPAYNEEKTIVSTVRSILQLTYADFEVIVINDGSLDHTLSKLIDEFGLQPFPQAVRIQLNTQPIRCIYRSTQHPQLVVVDKDNGGKADSLNTGINVSRYPLFCGVDADSVLQRDSLQLVVQPFLRSNEMVATGGTIRAANGCEVHDGYLTRIGLPDNLWARFQVMEYLRAFLLGRLGWSQLNAMLIISGAFGLFRKSTVIEVGGYSTHTLGEDMELIVRMHHVLRQRRQPYKIEFVPDPVCWTEVPEDRRTLRQQRIRWQRGLSESLNLHWPVMFNRNGGWVGWVAFPYMVLYEWLGPVIELAGYAWTLYAYWAGFLSSSAFLFFCVLSLGLGILLSIGGLLLEQASFQMYPRIQHTYWLLIFAILENLGYRQLMAWWRVIGLYKWITNSQLQWGDMQRIAHWQDKDKN